MQHSRAQNGFDGISKGQGSPSLENLLKAAQQEGRRGPTTPQNINAGFRPMARPRVITGEHVIKAFLTLLVEFRAQGAHLRIG